MCLFHLPCGKMVVMEKLTPTSQNNMTKATAWHKSFFTPINFCKKFDLHCVLSKTKLDFCLFHWQ